MKLTAAHLKRFKPALAHGVVALLFGLGTGQALAADINISNKPLDTLEGVPANIILTMDDSGSMAWGFLPDDRDDGNSENTNRFKSYVWNKIYYNPNITYTPGVDKNGTSLGDADFEDAWPHGFDKTVTPKINLKTSYQVTRRDYRPTTTSTNYDSTSGPAFYYVFDTSKTTTALPAGTCDISEPNHTDTKDDCYTLVEIIDDGRTFTTSLSRTDCVAAPTCTYEEESQNFANWYSYYRLRHLLAKTATSRAFAGLSTAVRIGWQELNRRDYVSAVLPFGGSHRDDFFTWLNTAATDDSTPLTDAFERAGEKFKEDAVYRKDPSNSSSEMYSCRQNFHFAFTDGFWNDNNVSIGNYDNANRSLPTTGTSPFGDINYTANTTLTADRTPPIYRDGNSNFLADIALKYWATDLKPGLGDDVPTFISDISTDIDGDTDVDNNDIFWNPSNDPADWQHMVNFTVGLGIDGVLPNSQDCYKDLIRGTSTLTPSCATWPTTGLGDDEHHVDDLWHAAINSRGRYFNAKDPEELLGGFKEVLDAIDDRIGSSSAVATTSSQYQTGTNLFQAIYDPSTWAGDLLAKDVITLTPQWSAATSLAKQIDGSVAKPRQVLTFDPDNGAGIPFLWSDLTSTQQTALNTLGGTADSLGSNRLDYLRGDASNELKNGGVFRNRTSPIGSLVHSDPFFLPPPGAPLFFWPDNLESDAYSTFVATYKNRMDMVLYGGNDGMLHVVEASNGYEIFSYVPNEVMNNLSNLTNPSYSHQFYVDAPVQVSDVYIRKGGTGSAAWRTVAVGGLGKGGKSIYALDVTNPSQLTETYASDVVMWEFTDPDLGYTYTRPQIFKMNDGTWVAAVGNGYNSARDTNSNGIPDTGGYATLFLIDLEDGSIVEKIATPKGILEDPTCASNPCAEGEGRSNRLTDVVAIDQNQDFLVDYLYAGDLFGNLWKFDVTDGNSNNWEIVEQGSTPTPLFIARDDAGNPQPITVPPAIQYHNKRNGFMVYVGTGKYVEGTDPADTSIQTVYGIWDREEDSGITTIERKYLLEQKILEANYSQFAATNARLTTNNNMTWYDGKKGLPTGNPPTEYLGWYMDLGNTDTSTGDTIPQGERVLDDLFVSGDRLEFITLIPSTNPCVGGGESWIFAVNAFTGSRFTNNTPWDYNLDGKYDTADKVDFGTGKIWGSGINLKTPQRFRRTKLLEPGADCQEVNLLNNADGSITTVKGSCQGFDYGRRSWRQIQIQ